MYICICHINIHSDNCVMCLCLCSSTHCAFIHCSHTKITKPIKRPFRKVRYLWIEKKNTFFTPFSPFSKYLVDLITIYLFLHTILDYCQKKKDFSCVAVVSFAKILECWKDDEIYASTDETRMHFIGNNSLGKTIWISVAYILNWMKWLDISTMRVCVRVYVWVCNSASTFEFFSRSFFFPLELDIFVFKIRKPHHHHYGSHTTMR